MPSKSELLRPLIEADLLVLDELGSQKPSTFVNDILYYVINSRYNAERTTIFTTNYPRRSDEKRSRAYRHAATEPSRGDGQRVELRAHRLPEEPKP